VCGITGIQNEIPRGSYQFIQNSNAKTFATIDTLLAVRAYTWRKVAGNGFDYGFNIGSIS